MSGRFFKHLSDTESESEDSEEEVIQTKAPIQPYVFKISIFYFSLKLNICFVVLMA